MALRTMTKESGAHEGLWGLGNSSDQHETVTSMKLGPQVSWKKIFRFTSSLGQYSSNYLIIFCLNYKILYQVFKSLYKLHWFYLLILLFNLPLIHAFSLLLSHHNIPLMLIIYYFKALTLIMKTWQKTSQTRYLPL